MLQGVKSLWRRSSKAAGELLKAGGRGVGADVAVAALRHHNGASGCLEGFTAAGLQYTLFIQVHQANKGGLLSSQITFTGF